MVLLLIHGLALVAVLALARFDAVREPAEDDP